MKIRECEYENLKNAISVVIADPTISGVVRTFKGRELFDAAAWFLIWSVFDDWMYDNFHPRYAVKKRLVPHRPSWSPYRDGLEDCHYLSAARKAARELGIF